MKYEIYKEIHLFTMEEFKELTRRDAALNHLERMIYDMLKGQAALDTVCGKNVWADMNEFKEKVLKYPLMHGHCRSKIFWCGNASVTFFQSFD